MVWRTNLRLKFGAQRSKASQIDLAPCFCDDQFGEYSLCAEPGDKAFSRVQSGFTPFVTTLRYRGLLTGRPGIGSLAFGQFVGCGGSGGGPLSQSASLLDRH